jgi:hypothetical protein
MHVEADGFGGDRRHLVAEAIGVFALFTGGDHMVAHRFPRRALDQNVVGISNL